MVLSQNVGCVIRLPDMIFNVAFFFCPMFNPDGLDMVPNISFSSQISCEKHSCVSKLVT